MLCCDMGIWNERKERDIGMNLLWVFYINIYYGSTKCIFIYIQIPKLSELP